MKLLFCPMCQDIVKLLKERQRTCVCGKSWGMYLENGVDSIYGGEAVVLGFGNETFMSAIRKLGGRGPDGLGWRFTAFVMPKDTPTVKFVPVKSSHDPGHKKSS